MLGCLLFDFGKSLRPCVSVETHCVRLYGRSSLWPFVSMAVETHGSASLQY
ncbi:MAG: hypothetical protein VSS75_020660 [Candidatus Parabeggiatoa sp.]|nr:hypothetical protein [Candidatus Parabeggiatoa sp.]